MRSWLMIAAMGALWPLTALAQEAVPVAKPIGSPAAWIPANGYPPAAKASAEEGRVGFMLSIDETGRPSDCKVTSSSGSPLLDDTACNFMLANGRFEPPKDKRGRAVPSRWSSSVRWRLDATEAAPAAPVVSAAPPAPVPVPANTKAMPARRADRPTRSR